MTGDSLPPIFRETLPNPDISTLELRPFGLTRKSLDTGLIPQLPTKKRALRKHRDWKGETRVTGSSACEASHIEAADISACG